MGVRQVGMEEVTGGELRGGGGYGGEVTFGFRRSLAEAEALGSSARLRGSSWWRWIGGGMLGCDAWHGIATATELAGDEEGRTFPSIAGCGRAMGVACGCLSDRLSSGSL